MQGWAGLAKSPTAKMPRQDVFVLSCVDHGIAARVGNERKLAGATAG